jgi:hypothetical protein
MGRTGAGAAIFHTPMTDAIIETIKTGSYYLVD